MISCELDYHDEANVNIQLGVSDWHLSSPEWQVTLRSDFNQNRGYFKTLQMSAWEGPRYNMAQKQSVAMVLNEETGIVHMKPRSLIPSQDKKKLVVLANLAEIFEHGKTYGALEVNQKLKSRFEDSATLRRDLIEFDFFERSADVKEYRRLA